jgi:hypothetical protein
MLDFQNKTAVIHKLLSLFSCILIPSLVLLVTVSAPAVPAVTTPPLHCVTVTQRSTNHYWYCLHVTIHIALCSQDRTHYTQQVRVLFSCDDWTSFLTTRYSWPNCHYVPRISSGWSARSHCSVKWGDYKWCELLHIFIGKNHSQHL